MANKIIILPLEEEMLQRLLMVDDSSHLQQHFYPKLLKEAGKEKEAMGVVMLLQCTIYEYLNVQDLPGVIVVTMNQKVPGFIDALVFDKEVAKEAKAHFEEAMSAN